ncbi:MAG TPA: transglutaminase domain-containing protein [Anaerolineales bacterium]|nr:transglutaminase domain-containing protein [Anaerolineales bacterium]
MTGLTLRFFKKLFTAEVIGLGLLLMALQTFTYGVSASLRNTDTQYFYYVGLLAVGLGWALGHRRSHPILASVGITLLGMAGVWIVGARLVSPLIDLFRSISAVIPLLVPALRSKTAIDVSAILNAWRVIMEASAALMLRIETWLVGLDRNVKVNDALVRNMIWLLLLWLVAAWAGWFSARRNAILALLPSVFLLAAVTSYSEYKIETVWVLMFVMLLLMGVWNYKNHTQQWETRKVDYSDSIRYDNTQAVLFLAIVIGFVALVTPSISWREIRDYLRERDQSPQNEAADMLGIQEQRVASKNVAALKPALPRDHLLTGGFAQSQKIVMTIRTGELPPIINSTITANAPRYYWRSAVYDEYVGAGWVTSSAPSQQYSANTPLIPGLLNDYKLVHLDVKLQEPEGRLYWSGILFSADVPLKVDWRSRPQSDLFADQAALLKADLFLASTNATAYKVDSYVPMATVDKLRITSTEYPQDILDKYLVLPREVPERVRKLAQEITAGKANPYDKAKAIETYLRANYPYDLNVPGPPPDRDVADFFLFDLKRGYCDYYATAMVVLSRANSIPARFVSGYAPGSYDAANAQYVVREMDAHSWAEVYFPAIGWVEFEATGSIPEIDRTGSDLIIPPDQNASSSASDLLNRFRLERAIYWLLPLFMIGILSLLYFAVIEKWMYMRLAPAIAIDRIYHKFYRAGRPFARARIQGETAHEFVARLKHRLNEESKLSRFKNLFDRLQNGIDHLTDIYHTALFRDQQMQKHDSRFALQIWRQLRWQLWLARLITLKINKINTFKT